MAAVNLLHETSCIPIYVYPEVGLLNHTVVLFLSFLGNSILFFIKALAVYM